MDGVTVVALLCMEARMDAQFWIELVIVVFRVLAAGMAG